MEPDDYKLNKIYNDIYKVYKNDIFDYYNKELKEFNEDSFNVGTFGNNLPNHKELVRLMREYVNKKEDAELKAAEEFDVYKDLDDAAKAKFQLHGECVVIPVEKLKEYVEKAYKI